MGESHEFRSLRFEIDFQQHTSREPSSFGWLFLFRLKRVIISRFISERSVSQQMNTHFFRLLREQVVV